MIMQTVSIIIVKLLFKVINSFPFAFINIHCGYSGSTRIRFESLKYRQCDKIISITNT